MKLQSHTQTIIITFIKEINIELLHVMEPCLNHFNWENVAVHCKFKIFFVILFKKSSNIKLFFLLNSFSLFQTHISFIIKRRDYIKKKSRINLK